MTQAVSVLTVVGARPQFIKAAMVSAVLAASPDFREILVHTGQHFDNDMSDVFFDELGMAPPALNLGIHGGAHGKMTGEMLIRLEAVIQSEKPEWVLVYGDTNSTLAGALAAAKLRVRICHVEAGLRSFSREMPEEINRVLTDHVSSLLLCPTRRSVANLAREGITRGVHLVGDVMYDASLAAAQAAPSDILTRLRLEPGEFSIATIHRAENVGSPEQLQELLTYLRQEAQRQPIVLPAHPHTREGIERWKLPTDPLVLIPPVSYLEMARLLSACTSVFTDSGGLQKEAYFAGKPCVTLRQETEWLETIECGWNRLWRVPDYQPRRPISEYGDGRAAGRIAELLRRDA